jgi:hypothetical protein
MRTFYILIAFLVIGQAALSQDTLYFTNKTWTVGKVIEINTKTISFKKQANIDGPSYTVNKSDVEKIVYTNGYIDYITTPRVEKTKTTNSEPEKSSSSTPSNATEYGKNIFCFTPLSVYDKGTGIGISYERFLDKKKYVSFYLPIHYIFLKSGASIGSSSSSGSSASSPYNYDFRPSIGTAQLGLKVYPFTGNNIFALSVGPMIHLAYGTNYYLTKYTNSTSYPYTYTQELVSEEKFVMGFMLHNGLQLTVAKMLYIGGELNLGICYSENFRSFKNTDDKPSNFIAQFNIKCGIRF